MCVTLSRFMVDTGFSIYISMECRIRIMIEISKLTNSENIGQLFLLGKFLSRKNFFREKKPTGLFQLSYLRRLFGNY